jgi:hypothetical protein
MEEGRSLRKAADLNRPNIESAAIRIPTPGKIIAVTVSTDAIPSPVDELPGDTERPPTQRLLLYDAIL